MVRAVTHLPGTSDDQDILLGVGLQRRIASLAPQHGANPQVLGHLQSLAEWHVDNMQSESYRRCCTSISWVGQALALHLLKAEKAWEHDAFFDYCDRWMHEDDKAFLDTLKGRHGRGLRPAVVKAGAGMG